MESGYKLNELNLTEDEVKRFTKAFKDEKFRVMLTDFVKEISDPDKKKLYEDEIKLLEQERGINVDFIHPEPFRVLRTSLNGKQKCFINICTNEKVGKPTFNWGMKDGRRGQHWSLPHSIHTGREEKDPKGNKFKIYDVVFHPDTLYMASKNTTFMDMVDNTAIQGIEDNLKVILDKNNLRIMKIKYKGTPQPCIIRKPIPGYKAEDQPAEADPLAFLYPNEKGPTVNTATTQVTEVPASKHRGVSEVQIQKSKEPTTPHYTVKYRSFIDLQDYRYSRDSAQSPRPKEIVVTVDVPLLKSARDTSLNVNGKSLVLESETPAYRLEVSLAYPVDEDKGEAKFNKHTGKLTVTLPVLPASETFVQAMGLTQTSHNSQGEEDEEIRGAEQEGQLKKWEKSDEINEMEEEHGKKQAQSSRQLNKEVDKSDKEEPRVKEEEVLSTGTIGEGEKREEGKSEQGTTEINKGSEEELCDRAEKCSVNSFHGDMEAKLTGRCSEENCSARGDVSPCVSENQPEVHKLSSGIEEEQGLAEQTSTSHVNVDIEEFRDEKLDTVPSAPSALNPPSSDKSQTEKCDAIELEPDLDQDCTTQGSAESRHMPDSDKYGPTDPEKLEEQVVDEDDLQTQQMCPTADCSSKALPALLVETDGDGKETVISYHSTSAGIVFQNSLVYELD